MYRMSYRWLGAVSVTLMLGFGSYVLGYQGIGGGGPPSCIQSCQQVEKVYFNANDIVLYNPAHAPGPQIWHNGPAMSNRQPTGFNKVIWTVKNVSEVCPPGTPQPRIIACDFDQSGSSSAQYTCATQGNPTSP